MERYSKDGLNLLLIELFSLVNTQYFVGTFSSQISRIVYELYHAKYLDPVHRTWSLDDPWYSDGYDLDFLNNQAVSANLLQKMPQKPSVLPSQKFYDALYARQHPLDCSGARLVSCDISKSQLGFGYQLHQLSKCILQAYKDGETAVLWPAQIGQYGSECGNRWDCFFEPISSCSGPAPAKSFDSFGEWIPPEVTDEQPSGSKTLPAIVTVGFVEKLLLRPNSRLNERIAKKSKADYGVHIRLTDKVSSGEGWAHTVEQYMQACDRQAMPHWNFHSAYGRNFGKTVFVASDNPAAIRETISRYPQYRIVQASSNLEEVSINTRYSKEGLDLLVEEVLGLSDTEFFVGTFSSQVSRIVYEVPSYFTVQ